MLIVLNVNSTTPGETKSNRPLLLIVLEVRFLQDKPHFQTWFVFCI